MKNRTRWFSIALILSGCFFTQKYSTFAQAELPNILQPSPNAASLGKYGEIPVSHYTGSSNISIPLYTVKSGDITIPISLDYHTGGIRLKDIAGWTGLGWSLTAGGVINRQLKDKDDLEVTSSFPDLVSKGQFQRVLPSGLIQPAPAAEFELGNIDKAFGIYSKELITTKGEHFNLWPIIETIDGYDREYDIFTFNFLGKSGKFIITRSGEVILEKRDDIKIIPPTGGVQFRIIDEKGFIYSFDSFEVASLNPNVGSYKSSWYLSKIESPKGNEVLFVYGPTTLPSLGQESRTISIGYSEFDSHTLSSTVYSQALILKEIVFDNGVVEFTRDQNRTDYPGERITGLKVNLTGGANTIVEYAFTYSYFDAQRMRLDKVEQKAGGARLPYVFSYNTPGSSPALNSFSFDHWGYYNGKSNSTIIPKFESGPVKYTTQPGVTILNFPFLALPGANREPDGQYMKHFSLKEVRYPTGGRTTIETEANTYEYDAAEMNRDFWPQCIRRDTLIHFNTRGDVTGQLSFISPHNVSEVTAIIAFIFTSNEARDLYRNGNLGKIYFEFYGNTRDIAGDFNTCGWQQCQSTLTAPPNAPVINYKSYIDPSVGNELVWVNLNLSWYEKVYKNSSNKKKWLTGGGLRVKKISDYDSDGTLIRSRLYDYHYRKDANLDGILEEHSYGKRMAPPTYAKCHIDEKVGDINGYVTSFQRFSSSIIPLSASVCYDKVIEYIVDKDGLDVGKTEYSFFNLQDSLYSYSIKGDPQIKEWFAGANSLSYKLNGSLLSKVDFKKITGGYEPVTELKNEYSTTLLNNYFGLLYEKVNFNTATYDYLVYDIYLIAIYPALRAERILQQKTIQKTYDDLDIGKSSVIETLYKYGSNHEQAVEVITKNSRSETEVKKVVFPPDYGILSSSTYGVKNLNDRHILMPIEQYTAVDGKLVSGVITTFKETLPLPDQVFLFQSTTPPEVGSFNYSNKSPNSFTMDSRYAPRLNYEQYDSEGNLEVVSKMHDGKIVYLWGYDKKYPIAEIKNATFAQVAYTSFESGSQEGNWSFTGAASTSSTAKTGKSVYPLSSNNTISKNLTTGKYNLEYYAKSPIVISTGGTGTVTDLVATQADVNGWILYKKRIDLSSPAMLTLNTSAGSVTELDELRLYPDSGFMSSYTYDPLVGISSIVDVNGTVTYYEYDLFNRLKLVRDDKGKILKTFGYNYKDQK